MRTEEGDGLVVSLPFPDAKLGATLQAGNQTVQIIDGAAKLNLGMEQLGLGVNKVELTYVEPGGKPREMGFELLLRHKVKEDLLGMASADPYFTVTFQVVAGVQLRVEGQVVAPSGGAYDHKVQVAGILPPGGVSSETFLHRIPFQLMDAAGGVE